MKFINWIKSLFAPKPLEPVQDGWREMAAKKVIKELKVELGEVRRGVESGKFSTKPLPKPARPAPPMPKVKPAQHPLEPYAARANNVESNLDIMPYAYAYAATHHYDDTPVRSSDDDTRSSFSSSFSSSDSGSSSSDSFSSGGGSFDGGGSSGDW